ncbi:hypothetical protein B0H14DRAFT_3875862 [Mycena olivaceomarginata]|nr:hypothetical protein B0H14DRAFT_3875862 [Mycena olivaceomarginata]
MKLHTRTLSRSVTNDASLHVYPSPTELHVPKYSVPPRDAQRLSSRWILRNVWRRLLLSTIYSTRAPRARHHATTHSSHTTPNVLRGCDVMSLTPNHNHTLHTTRPHIVAHPKCATLAFLAAHVTSVPSAHRNRLQHNHSPLLEAHTRGPPRPMMLTTHRMRSPCHLRSTSTAAARRARLDASPTRRLPPLTSAAWVPHCPWRLGCLAAHRDPVQLPSMQERSHRPNVLLVRTGTTMRSTTAMRSPRWSHCLSTALSSSPAPSPRRYPPPSDPAVHCRAVVHREYCAHHHPRAQRSHRPFFVTRVALIGCVRTTTYSAWAHSRFSEHARRRFASMPHAPPRSWAGPALPVPHRWCRTRRFPARRSRLHEQLGLRFPDISTLLHAASMIPDRDALDARGSPDSQFPETPAAFQGSTPAACTNGGVKD